MLFATSADFSASQTGASDGFANSHGFFRPWKCVKWPSNVPAGSSSAPSALDDAPSSPRERALPRCRVRQAPSPRQKSTNPVSGGLSRRRRGEARNPESGVYQPAVVGLEVRNPASDARGSSASRESE